MAIIDCHSHALPNLEQYADQLPASIRDLIGDKAPLIQETAETLLGALPISIPQVPISPKHLSDLRKNGPSLLHKGLEYFSSLSLAAPTLVHGTIHQLLESMQRNQIEKSVVIAAPPLATNEWLLAIAGDYPDQIIPVAFTPDLPAESRERAWTQAYESLARQGARGFKIHPNMNPYPIHHIAYETLFATAQRNDLFVIIHTGCFSIPSYTNQRPAEAALFAEYFERYRDVRVCLAHMNRDHPERAWDIMKRYENVYADTSWQSAESIRAAINEVGSDRIVLGSDWPLLNDELQTTNIEAVQGGTDDDDTYERIMDTNARRLIGLSS